MNKGAAIKSACLVVSRVDVAGFVGKQSKVVVRLVNVGRDTRRVLVVQLGLFNLILALL